VIVSESGYRTGVRNVLLVIAGLAIAGFLADRLLLWMEWRGWIDYRRTDPGRINPGQVGPAFLAIQGLLEPDKKHAVEEQTRLRTERDEQGGGADDPRNGRGDRAPDDRARGSGERRPR
jgi:hypothetical protein